MPLFIGLVLYVPSEKEQAGTGPSRRHIQGSKIAKRLPSVNLQYSKIEKAKKMDRQARRGPLALPKGDTSEIVNNFVAVEGGTLWRKNKFSKKKSHNAENLKGGTLWSRPVWYVTRKTGKKHFWFSSLGQMVQFDTIIFCRTFKNYFGQFVWIEKKVTIIVAFHFMKRRLKIKGGPFALT